MKDKQISKVPGTWYEVDFHVHTPSSFDFEVQTDNEESSYIGLLEKAKDSKIDVIVCTDHNDINGYKKLIDIQNDLKGTKRTLTRNNSEILEPLLSQISLFEEIVFLPGVELDIKPCFHILVIFDPISLELASDFLTNAGFTPDVRGREDSASYWKWSLDDVFVEAQKINAIVLGAHVDSNKGLYNNTENWGRARIDAYTNDALWGMEFINPVQRDKIESILKDPKYSRGQKLAFIQSSDYHGKSSQRIGERRTYVRMDDVDKSDKASIFSALKRALRNPDEYISAPGRPELRDILEKLDKQPSVETIQTENDQRTFVELVCAWANSGGGTITIGKNLKGNWVGITAEDEKAIRTSIEELIKTSVYPEPQFGLDIYPYGNKYIATVQVKMSLRACSLIENDRFFLLESGQPKIASRKALIDLIETRLIERYSKLWITHKLSDMAQRLSGTQDSIDILPIVRKIDQNSHYLSRELKKPMQGEIFTDEFITTRLICLGTDCLMVMLLFYQYQNLVLKIHT